MVSLMLNYDTAFWVEVIKNILNLLRKKVICLSENNIPIWAGQKFKAKQ